MQPMFRMLLITGLSFLTIACGDDAVEPETDAAGVQDTGTNSDTVSTDQTSIGGLTCLPAGTTILGTENIVSECTQDTSPVGQTYLIETMEVTEPANDALLSQLNTLWASDIETGKLIILFHIVDRDDEAGTSTILVGSGKVEGDVYSFESTPSTVSLSVSNCNYATAAPADLTLAPQSLNKPVHMTAVDVCGQFAADATGIPFSFLAGSIREEDATGIEVSINPDEPDFTVDLAELLGSFVDLDMDTDGDGTMDAWALKGTLTGKAIANFEAN
jgi:hypothetical protein